MGFSKDGPTGTGWLKHPYLPVAGLALILRAGWALMVPVAPVSDGFAYNLLAQNLANGTGYCWAPGVPTAYWPVGTSFIYSLFYRVFGLGFTPIVVFNIFISLGTVWLTMILAERWFGPRVALVTGVLFAAWPVQIEFTTVLASELIFNFLVVLLLVVWEQPRLNTWLKAALVGLLGAATCYIRPVGLFLPAILYAISINRERRFVLPVLKAGVAFGVMALAIAPWSLRNERVFGKFEMISTNGGTNLWMGNNPDGPGITKDLPAETLKMQEAERDVYLGRVARTYMREYPGRFLMRTLKKALWLHDHETIGVHWNLVALERKFGEAGIWRLKLLSDLYWWAMLPLGFAGVCLLLMRQGGWVLVTSPPVVLWAYFTTLHAVIVVQDRYHFPSAPFIGILAALAVCTAQERWAGRKLKAVGQAG